MSVVLEGLGKDKNGGIMGLLTGGMFGDGQEMNIESLMDSMGGDIENSPLLGIMTQFYEMLTEALDGVLDLPNMHELKQSITPEPEQPAPDVAPSAAPTTPQMNFSPAMTP